MLTSGLPIDATLPALREALARSSSAVLQAPPGAGKSTVVPLALLDEPWARGKRILMLEPRRLAARAVAQRMSQTLGEAVGRTVGYRMRMDTRVSRDTRIEVVTEGVLTRMLQNDPALEGIAVVIFDEFHERSLQADLGLALVLDARENLTPDLKVLVMSATLDGEAVARLLGDAPIVTSEGRMFPVESRFAGKGAPPLPGPPFGPGGPVDSPEKITAQLVLRALREETGDVLVFLPGAREIRRVQSLLGSGRVRRPPSVSSPSSASYLRKIRTPPSRLPLRHTQSRARDQHRRDESDHPRRTRRGRLRTRPSLDVRSIHGHESSRNAADLPRLRGPAAG